MQITRISLNNNKNTNFKGSPAANTATKAVEVIADYFPQTKMLNFYSVSIPAGAEKKGYYFANNYNLNGTKDYNKYIYDLKFADGNLHIAQESRNYKGKTLVSKLKEYHGKDDAGEYFTKQETFYLADGKTVSQTISEKFYKYTDEDGYIRYKKPIKIINNFKNGVREYSILSDPKVNGDIIKFYDAKGKNVIASAPYVSSSGPDISYYGNYGSYTPENGLQRY